jgi:hypothetical protein
LCTWSHDHASEVCLVQACGSTPKQSTGFLASLGELYCQALTVKVCVAVRDHLPALCMWRWQRIY